MNYSLASRNLLEKVKREAEAERRAKEEAKTKAKRKKILFIRRLFALSFLMVGLFTICSLAEDVVHKNSQSQVEKKIEQYEKVKVLIRKGDRAWTIQKKLTPNKDVREMLYLASKINHRSMGNLKEGEVVTFLREKNK